MTNHEKYLVRIALMTGAFLGVWIALPLGLLIGHAVS